MPFGLDAQRHQMVFLLLHLRPSSQALQDPRTVVAKVFVTLLGTQLWHELDELLGTSPVLRSLLLIEIVWVALVCVDSIHAII